MTEFKSLLEHTKVIAIVGLSKNPDRPSFQVAQFIQNQGYKIVPVNPNESEILGEPCYPTLEDIPHPVDMVDVFRKAEDCPAIARSAIAIGAKSVWLQLGIVSEEAEHIVKNAGLEFVMNHCLKIEYRAL
jgi:predicted CoA-binding protein